MLGSPRPAKSRGVAILLALFLGGVGGHKFYLGQIGWGLAYLFLCFTFLPLLVSIGETVGFLLTSDADFHAKYG